MARQGKKVTREQAKILSRYGIIDYSDWRYLGSEATKVNGDSSPSKNHDCVIKYIFRNVSTNEVLKLV
jgi:hypothetical protein